MAKPKQKGNKYEIKTARRFSLWYTNNERDDIFWHSSSSGATATNQMKRNQCSMTNSCGDLCYLDAIGKSFCDLTLVEFKSGYTDKIKKNKSGKLTKTTGKKISITDLLDSKNRKNDPLLIEWFRKAQKEAIQHKRKHPIVVFQRDRRSSCIVFDKITWLMLEQNNNKDFIFPHNGNICFVGYKEFDLAILKLSDFFAWCHPKAFEQKIEFIKYRKYKVGKYSKNPEKLKVVL